MMIDLTSEFGRRVADRLQKERIIWLTTLAQNLTPQPRPVWFLWDDGMFRIYSRPDTHKLNHITRHPSVSLNLDSDGRGGNIVVFTGTAHIEDGPSADQVPAYIDKYRENIERLHMTVEQFAQDYSVFVRVVPTYLRGH